MTQTVEQRYDPAPHSHGPGSPVPEQSRAERNRSFELGEFPMPTGREEHWRFTPLAQIRAALEPGATPAEVQIQAPDVVQVIQLEAGQSPRGTALIPGDRAAALAHAGSLAAQGISIPDEVELSEAIRVTITGSGQASVGHVVIDAGRHSRATVVIEHLGSGQFAGNVEIRVGAGADLTVVSLQNWAADAVHLGQQDALVGRDAQLKHVVVSLGGKVVRLNANVTYAGPGASATLLGVYFADAGQHLEHRSFVDHNTPNCSSLVTYKGALQGATARTVWVGDVQIQAAAEGTETYELNRNLLLSEGARADSVPNLEIETGQIAGAGHASATGRFDDEQLFYLQARGIPEVEARRLVVRGFFADVVQQIGVTDVQEQVMAAIELELGGVAR